MLLAVFSVDWWGRERDEGYASFVLPTPGKFLLQIYNFSMLDIGMCEMLRSSVLM